MRLFKNTARQESVRTSSILNSSEEAMRAICARNNHDHVRIENALDKRRSDLQIALDGISARRSFERQNIEDAITAKNESIAEAFRRSALK